MGHLVDRPEIYTTVEPVGRVLAVVSYAIVKNTPDGSDRVIKSRDLLSVFHPLRSKAVPVNLDAKLALVFGEIEADQREVIADMLDYIDAEGFLAFDMVTGRVVPGAAPNMSRHALDLPLP